MPKRKKRLGISICAISALGRLISYAYGDDYSNSDGDEHKADYL